MNQDLPTDPSNPQAPDDVLQCGCGKGKNCPRFEHFPDGKIVVRDDDVDAKPVVLLPEHVKEFREWAEKNGY